jgi:hypothetical protein
VDQHILSAFACVIAGRSATYVSIPITTGKDFLSWYTNIGKSLKQDVFDTRHRSDVIIENIRRARQYISALRQRHLENVIIEPTSLEVPDWSQQQYLKFWGEVITRFVNRVYFCPGWSYSRGCAYEFLITSELSIEALDIDGRPITISEGRDLVIKAAEEYNAIGLESDFLFNITAKLDLISSANAKPSL